MLTQDYGKKNGNGLKKKKRETLCNVFKFQLFSVLAYMWYFVHSLTQDLIKSRDVLNDIVRYRGVV